MGCRPHHRQKKKFNKPLSTTNSGTCATARDAHGRARGQDAPAHGPSRVSVRRRPGPLGSIGGGKPADSPLAPLESMRLLRKKWSRRSDSNRRPADYEWDSTSPLGVAGDRYPHDFLRIPRLASACVRCDPLPFVTRLSPKPGSPTAQYRRSLSPRAVAAAECPGKHMGYDPRRRATHEHLRHGHPR